MEKLIANILEDCKKDKKLLVKLKGLLVECQSYDIAAQLRDYEKKNFPDTEEEIQAKMYDTALRMVKIHVHDLKTAYIMSEVSKLNLQEFDIRQASELLKKAGELFD